MKSHKQVLILTSARETGWIDDASNNVSRGLHTFIDALNQGSEVDYFVSTLDKLDFEITTDHVTILDRYNKKDMSEYDIVHFRNVTLASDFVRAIAIYMLHAGKLLLDSVDTQQPEYGKLSQMVLFALNGLSVPHTWATWHVSELTKLYIETERGYPFIMKANDGIKGQDNYLIKSDTDLWDSLQQNPGQQYVIQEYIPNDKDFRILYFAEGEPLVFSRTAAKDSHLNNTSQGGSSSEINIDEFDKNALNLAKNAARLTKRTLSGVDVMQNSETKQWVVLEVNANPALSSGDLLDKKVIRYIKMTEEML